MYLQTTCLFITFWFQSWIVTCLGMSCGQFFVPFDFGRTKYTSVWHGTRLMRCGKRWFYRNFIAQLLRTIFKEPFAGRLVELRFVS